MLITPDYLKQQREMHASIPEYGCTAQRYGEMVASIIDAQDIETVADYGAGHNLSLMRTCKPRKKFTYRPYDPGVEEYSDAPLPSQLVVCIDVLEHIEPECLDRVLDHLEELTEQVLFCTVHTGPAAKHLPDGRNAHLIQQDIDWWFPRLSERFYIHSITRRDMSGFEAICLARAN